MPNPRKLTTMFSAAMVAVALTITPALGASAATNPPYVTKTEFGQLKFGMTRSAVASLFGTSGRTYAENEDYILKEYRIAYGKRSYSVDLTFWVDDRGVYRMVDYSAIWTYKPNRTQDPATKTEYSKIKLGHSLAQVRATIGSAGTIWFDNHADLESQEDLHIKSFLWPVSYNSYGEVQITFERNASGTYVVTDKWAFWS